MIHFISDPDDLDEIDGLFVGGSGVLPTGDLVRSTSIVAVISAAGGTGKTSIAVNLAGLLSSCRRRATVMDLDPRRSVQRWAAAGSGLPFRVHEFDATSGAAAFRRALREAAADADLLVLDTPPSLGLASRLALQVADLVLIPTGVTKLDLAATEEAVDEARAAQHGRDGTLPRVMVVPSRQNARTRLARQLAHRLERLEVSVGPAIGQRVEVAEAATSGRLVRSSSLAGREFRRLAKSVWASVSPFDR